ncbi:hypothetical protein RSO41_05170 [Halomonas sp. I1]|uniref:hypothetical protein n=1 Tax=Halomonas sp. I1 TaxID=393536 RepID=UPI0028DFFCB6|nr:hypothetical protein [Halomonas sp. I1]MDT8894038.1 hypothetical protein [Halomonas sp. I1]
MKYETRVVAFIDILGFKTILDDTIDKDGSDNEQSIDRLVSAYTAIRDVWDLDAKEDLLGSDSPESKKVSIFSDSIVVSFKAEEPSEVFFTLLEIKWLIMRLISRKILVRGAVSIGKFIHNDHYLFGPALVEAYTLESKAAMYPRVILDSSVIEASAKAKSPDHSSSQEANFVRSLLEQDSDGMYYIDYFFKAQSELDDPQYDFPQYIDNLGDVIRKGLMASSHHTKADLRVKYSWMRERYNKMVEIVTNKDSISRLRSEGLEELSDFYQGLKKISPDKYNKAFQRTQKKLRR